MQFRDHLEEVLKGVRTRSPLPTAARPPAGPSSEGPPSFSPSPTYPAQPCSLSGPRLLPALPPTGPPLLLSLASQPWSPGSQRASGFSLAKGVSVDRGLRSLTAESTLCPPPHLFRGSKPGALPCALLGKGLRLLSPRLCPDSRLAGVGARTQAWKRTQYCWEALWPWLREGQSKGGGRPERP